jgi:hypothetical protein
MSELRFSNPNIDGGLASLLLGQQPAGQRDCGDLPNASMTGYGNMRTAPLILRAAQRLVGKVVEPW